MTRSLCTAALVICATTTVAADDVEHGVRSASYRDCATAGVVTPAPVAYPAPEWINVPMTIAGPPPLFRYDEPDPWLHGYFQPLPAHHGFKHFRPYNYKHVYAQSRKATEWGHHPQLPYSQQFWTRYQYDSTPYGEGQSDPVNPHIERQTPRAMFPPFDPYQR